VAIDDSKVEEWLAACKREAITIDPETAEVTWRYAQTFDPYGVDPGLPEEYQQVGREFFARRPAGDIWVWFGDLPRETQNRLVELHGLRLYFPVGLEDMLCAFE
jgi:hypothetical protein